MPLMLSQVLLCITPTAKFKTQKMIVPRFARRNHLLGLKGASAYHQIDASSRTNSGKTVSPDKAIGDWIISTDCPIR